MMKERQMDRLMQTYLGHHIKDFATYLLFMLYRDTILTEIREEG